MDRKTRITSVCLAAMSAAVLATSMDRAEGSDRRRPSHATGSRVVVLPAPEPVTQYTGAAPDLQIKPRIEPTIPRVLEPSPWGECENGMCQPYYRNRPRGDCDDKRRIILNNRLGEPEWYKYYRCEHFGYHPTQWHAWPQGWLDCRHPHPGEHPYDRRQQLTDGEKGSLKDFLKQTPRSSTSRDPDADMLRDRDGPVPPPRVREEPKQLPPNPLDLTPPKKIDEKSIPVPKTETEKKSGM